MQGLCPSFGFFDWLPGILATPDQIHGDRQLLHQLGGEIVVEQVDEAAEGFSCARALRVETADPPGRRHVVATGVGLPNTLRITPGRAALRNSAALSALPHQRFQQRPYPCHPGWLFGQLSSIKRWAQSINTTPRQRSPSSCAARRATTPPMELPTNSTGRCTTSCRSQPLACPIDQSRNERHPLKRVHLSSEPGADRCVRNQADRWRRWQQLANTGWLNRQWLVFAPKP